MCTGEIKGCEQEKKIQVEYCEKKFHVECIVS